MRGLEEGFEDVAVLSRLEGGLVVMSFVVV